MTGSLYWFERKYLLNSQVRITLVCQSLFWGKKVFLIKWPSAGLKQLCCVFLWGQPLTLGVQQECFMHTSRFVTENVRKICIQGLRFHKILIFYVFIKDILSETAIFSPCKCLMTVKRHWLLPQSLCFDLCEGRSSFSHLCLAPLVPMSTEWKRHITF